MQNEEPADITREAALEAFYLARQQLTDVPEMTLDEINAEIAAARAAGKNKSIKETP